MERSRSIPLLGLAVHRRRRGLTQRQLGELAGVAHTTVQRLETLSRGAYPQTMQKLASALGVAPEELLDGESTPLKTTHPRTPCQESVQREVSYE